MSTIAPGLAARTIDTPVGPRLVIVASSEDASVGIELDEDQVFRLVEVCRSATQRAQTHRLKAKSAASKRRRQWSGR